MSRPRYTVLHLLLGITLIGLLLGFMTPLWRAGSHRPPLRIDHFCLSPDGRHLAVHYSDRLVRVWSMGSEGPRLFKEVSPMGRGEYLGQPEHGGIFFRDDDHLLWIEAGDSFPNPAAPPLFRQGPKTVLHELNLQSGRASELMRLSVNYD